MLFEKVSFRAIIPAPEIVRATFSWLIYLNFFVLFLWKLSKKRCHRFFLFLFNDLWRWNKVRIRWKTPVFVLFEIFRKVNFRTLKFCGSVLKINTRSSGRNKETGHFWHCHWVRHYGENGYFGTVFGHLGYVNLHEELRKSRNWLKTLPSIKEIVFGGHWSRISC